MRLAVDSHAAISEFDRARRTSVALALRSPQAKAAGAAPEASQAKPGPGAIYAGYGNAKADAAEAKRDAKEAKRLAKAILKFWPCKIWRRYSRERAGAIF